jgi:L-asparagine transporter-like permease
MYDILLSLHSILRWIILLLLVLNLIRHFAAMNRPFNGIDKQLGLWLMIAAHITLLIGLYQWFAGALGFQNIVNNGMGAVMKNGGYRFFAVEHTIGMLIAIALITIARGMYRKELPDGKKHRRCIVFYILSLVIILAFIPWPGMEEIGRPLFRGF